MSLARAACGLSTPRTSRLRTILGRERLLAATLALATMYLPHLAQLPTPGSLVLLSWPVLLVRLENHLRMKSRVSFNLLRLRFLHQPHLTTLMMVVQCVEADAHGDPRVPRRRMITSLPLLIVESHLWLQVLRCRRHRLRLLPKTIIPRRTQG